MTSVFLDEGPSCFDVVNARLASRRPLFLSRIGGSDTDAVAAYVGERDSERPTYQTTHAHLGRVMRFNGYYDSENDPARFIDFCATLLRLYCESDLLSMCGPPWTHLYFPDLVYQKHVKLNQSLEWYKELYAVVNQSQRDLTVLPYRFIEKLINGNFTLFRSFERVLTNKKVLVISPFSKSIEYNFSNRKRFFPKYDYPDFDLKLYDTPITYANQPASCYPDSNWFETTSRMREEITNIAFDLALLSCGSYAMPLGVHIRDKLQRQAIYVGGILQLFFGIMGRRYQNQFYLSQVNSTYFIRPLESSKFRAQVELGNKDLPEAFGAYF